MANDPAPTTTIDEALDSFLAEQRARLSNHRFGNYQDVIRLLRNSLNNYGYMSLDDEESKRLMGAEDDEDAEDAEDDKTFCRLFGPEKIEDELDEFLGYYMVRKVAADEELLKAAGAVARKLVQWLTERGHIEAPAKTTMSYVKTASRDLVPSQKLGDLLQKAISNGPRYGSGALSLEDRQSGTCRIDRVERGRLWVTQIDGEKPIVIGPIAIPVKARKLARSGWEVYLGLVRVKGVWHVTEAGFVYPC